MNYLTIVQLLQVAEAVQPFLDCMDKLQEEEQAAEKALETIELFDLSPDHRHDFQSFKLPAGPALHAPSSGQLDLLEEFLDQSGVVSELVADLDGCLGKPVSLCVRAEGQGCRRTD